MKIPPDQLLAEFEDLIRCMPPRETLHHYSPEIQDWFGRALALVNMWSPTKMISFERHITDIHSGNGMQPDDGRRGVLRTLNQARHELRLQTVGPLTIAVETGRVFDYFDEIRKVIEQAKADLFFVDPYLDAEFVSRYLPHIGSGVAIRLLARERLQTLMPAVELLRVQQNLLIEVRSALGFHDRFLFVDKVTCYQSGASFKDGAKKSPTTLTQSVDAFSAIFSTYDQLWNAANVVP